MSFILSSISLFIKDLLFFVSYVKNQAFPQPLSKKDEEMYLNQMFAGDKDARDKLIEHNLRLVAHIVKKFHQTNEDPEDLISIGTIGLIKAVESFKAKKGTKLATYAARCIENEILMYFRRLKKMNKDISLESPIGQDTEGNEISLMDIIEAENINIIELLQKNSDVAKLQNYLQSLTPREREVIIYRYGLGNRPELTQKIISEKLNISRSYVSRIEKRALMKILRKYLQAENNHIQKRPIT